MTWLPCDLYECMNEQCKSKILVLQPPRTALGAGVAPLCVCGRPLERLSHDVEVPLRTWTF